MTLTATALAPVTLAGALALLGVTKGLRFSTLDLDDFLRGGGDGMEAGSAWVDVVAGGVVMSSQLFVSFSCFMEAAGLVDGLGLEAKKGDQHTELYSRRVTITMCNYAQSLTHPCTHTDKTFITTHSYTHAHVQVYAHANKHTHTYAYV